jgi:hypothetical protein
LIKFRENPNGGGHESRVALIAPKVNKAGSALEWDNVFQPEEVRFCNLAGSEEITCAQVNCHLALLHNEKVIVGVVQKQHAAQDFVLKKLERTFQQQFITVLNLCVLYTVLMAD